MFKKIIYLFLASWLLAISFASYAALKLELTQGVDKAIVLNLVALPMSGNASDVASKLMNVVQNDLQNSGRFQVIASAGIAVNKIQAATFDYGLWRDNKVDNVVTYKVTQQSGNNYQVEFYLYDIYGKSELVNKTFSVKLNAVRVLSHHISDIIYAKLLGIPGVFATKIAYVLVTGGASGKAKYYLQVADADGYNPRSLLISSEPIMSPAWSPDSKKIAYVSFEKHRAAIYVQEVASGARSVISQLPGVNGAPAWSHDGKKIALVLTKTGMPKIYLVDLASQKLTQLTTGYAIDTEPNFAPDDKSLIFTSNRGGGPQIYKLDLVTNKISRVTYQGDYNARASYSPDGGSIVMIHREEGGFNIALQDLASGRVTNLSRVGFEESPSFAPNSAMVVYATNVGGKGILEEVSTDGKVVLKLPAKDGTVQEPAWGGR